MHISTNTATKCQQEKPEIKVVYKMTKTLSKVSQKIGLMRWSFMKVLNVKVGSLIWWFISFTDKKVLVNGTVFA